MSDSDVSVSSRFVGPAAWRFSSKHELQRVIQSTLRADELDDSSFLEDFEENPEDSIQETKRKRNAFHSRIKRKRKKAKTDRLYLCFERVQAENARLKKTQSFLQKKISEALRISSAIESRLSELGINSPQHNFPLASTVFNPMSLGMLPVPGYQLPSIASTMPPQIGPAVQNTHTQGLPRMHGPTTNAALTGVQALHQNLPPPKISFPMQRAPLPSSLPINTLSGIAAQQHQIQVAPPINGTLNSALTYSTYLPSLPPAPPRPLLQQQLQSPFGREPARLGLPPRQLNFLAHSQSPPSSATTRTAAMPSTQQNPFGHVIRRTDLTLAKPDEKSK